MMRISLDYAAASFKLHASILSAMNLWPLLEPLTLYKDARHDSSLNVKPKHLNRLLVARCSIGHNKPPPSQPIWDILASLLASSRSVLRPNFQDEQLKLGISAIWAWLFQE